MIERRDFSQYNPEFDSRRFRSLMAQKETAGFEVALATERAYIGAQLKTDLGERLHVAKSTYEYEIREGKLYEPGRIEPFEAVFERGMGRKAVDIPRERAEFLSFRTMQAVLASPDSPDGTMVLDVSPRGEEGTNYEENNFDVHTKAGNRVISTRYRSDLSNDGYRRKIVTLNPTYGTFLPDMPTDVDLKSTPVVIPSYLKYSNPDVLAKFLLGGEMGITQEQLDEVWVSVTPLATSYINTLVENPQDLYSLEMNYRALLNASHKTSEHVASQKFTRGEEVVFDAGRLSIDTTVKTSSFNWSGTRIEIEMLASEPVKIGGGACGSGSCSTSTESSSGDVPSDPLDNFDGRGNIYFRCKCGALNKRELFSYVTNCQECGSDEVLPPSLRGKSFQPGQTLK